MILNRRRVHREIKCIRNTEFQLYRYSFHSKISRSFHHWTENWRHCIPHSYLQSWIALRQNVRAQSMIMTSASTNGLVISFLKAIPRFQKLARTFSRNIKIVLSIKLMNN